MKTIDINDCTYHQPENIDEVKHLVEQAGNHGVAYLANQYKDTWHKWMNLRKEMDPLNIFLTAFWAEHLGL